MGKKRLAQEIETEDKDVVARTGSGLGSSSAQSSKRRKRRATRTSRRGDGHPDLEAGNDDESKSTYEEKTEVDVESGVLDAIEGSESGLLARLTDKHADVVSIQRESKDVSSAVSDFRLGYEKLAEAYSDLRCPRLANYTSDLIALVKPLHKSIWSEGRDCRTIEQGGEDECEDTHERGEEHVSPDFTALKNQFEALETELNKMKRQHKQLLKEQNIAIAALETETTALRLDVDMSRMQREQQRQWNKRALKEQADGFHEEHALIKKHINAQTAQQQDLKELRAELAELRASLADDGSKPPRQLRTNQHPTTTKTVRTRKEEIKVVDEKQQVQVAAIPDHVTKELRLLENNIKARQKQWDFFLSREGNYMYVPNLENGLKDILRDIRQFNIRNPRFGEMAFELVMMAATRLFEFTVRGENAEQDFYSVPLKLRAWAPVDEFGALLARGQKWDSGGAKIVLGMIEIQKEQLGSLMAKRMPELRFDCWFSQTAAALEMCLRRKHVA